MTASATVRTAKLAESPPWGLATLWLLGLGPFFFATYALANWVTSLRAEIPSLVFTWEHQTPFLAWTIVPYWSLDLLYAVSLFICRTRTELNTHAKRLLAAQLISVFAFLLFPLRFTFDRPQPLGIFGSMFDILSAFDKPFNQAPSLHVSLATILWVRYSEHLDGATLWLTRFWLILTAISTMTTYQHHFIDLPTGLWVGCLCVALFRDDRTTTFRDANDDPFRIKVGNLYLAAAAALIGLAWTVGGVAWFLLWPAGALSVVAGVYYAGRPGLFRKQNGAIAPAILFLLAPYVALAWLNSRLWTRRRRAAGEIRDGVWLGPLPKKSERDEKSVASMVDLTAELPVDTSGIRYRAVPMLDLVAPTLNQLDLAVRAIEDLGYERPTLVCCALGYSRSAAAVAAWLTSTRRTASLNDSISLIEAQRPQIVLSASYRKRLDEWCNARLQKSR